MNGENIIRESSALRGARRFDDAINLIESNIEKIPEDIKLNALMEFFTPRRRKGIMRWFVSMQQ